MQRKFLSLILAICMVISTITPLMAGEITILTPRMGEENTTPKEDKGDIMVLDPILSEPETPKVIDDKKPKEQPKLDVSEENEPLILGAGNSGDFKTEKRADGLYITGLSDTFEGLNITIPKEVDGEPVVGIADGAFLSKKLSITFEQNPNLKYIGNHAFFENNVGPLDFKDTTDLVIGDYAFSKNKIMNVRFGENTEIGEYAFRDNGLINLDLSGVSKLGLGSFSNNRIINLTNINVDLPKYSFINNNLSKIETEHLVDALALTHNHRYVRVLTGNKQNETSKVPNGFGHVVNPVLVRVKFINKERMEEIMPMKIMGDDMSREGEVFILNKENTLKVPQIDGYVPIEKSVTFTPDKDNYDLVLYYKPTDGKPEIVYTAPDKPTWPGDVIDEAYLLSLVKATDMLGNDITDKIEVEPKVLDTNPGGEKDVSYTVTDEFGNTQVLNVKISVGLGWMPVRFDGDWTYGDFTYDGDAVTGLTPEGEKKLDGTRELVIPPKVPDNSVREYEKLLDVKRIGNAAFKEKEIGNWLKMPDTIEEIGDEAFSQTDIHYGINTEIELYTQYESKKKEFDILSQGIDSVREKIELYIKMFKPFYDSSPKLVLPKNLKRIGKSAFMMSISPSDVIPMFVDIVLPDSLEDVEETAFYCLSPSNISVNIPQNLKYLKSGAFYNVSLRDYNILVPRTLKVFEGQGFLTNYYKGFNTFDMYHKVFRMQGDDIDSIIFKKISFDFSNAESLEYLGVDERGGNYASYSIINADSSNGSYYFLDKINLSNLNNLKYIGEGVFKGSFVDGDIVIKNLPNLEGIGKDAFSVLNNTLFYTIFNNLSKSKISPGQGYEISVEMYKRYLPEGFLLDKERNLYIEDCPKLKEIQDNAFFSQFRSNIVLRNLETFEGFKRGLKGTTPTNIETENLPSVKSLDGGLYTGYLDSYRLKKVDLRGMTNLENINKNSDDDYGFTSIYPMDIYIPTSVKNIQNRYIVMLGKDEDKYISKVYIDGGVNPNNLKNGNFYIINPGPFRARFVTEKNGVETELKEMLKVENFSSGSIYSPPHIDNYAVLEYSDGGRKSPMPKNGEVEVNLNTGGLYTFYYKKLNEKPTNYIKFTSSIEGRTTLESGRNGKYYVDLSVIDVHDNESLDDARIIVNFPTFVDINSVEIPKSDNIKEVVKKSDSVEVVIKNMGRGESLSIPMLFKFKDYITPKNTDFKISSLLLSSNKVDILARGNDSIIKYDYPEPNHVAYSSFRAKGTSDSEENSGGPLKGAKIDFLFKIPNGQGFTVFRFMDEYQIKVKIPTYTKVLEDGTDVVEKAVFSSDENKGWVQEGNYFILKDKVKGDFLNLEAKLCLDFPNAKENSTNKPSGTTFEYEATVTPKNKTENEPLFIYKGITEEKFERSRYSAPIITEGFGTKIFPNVYYGEDKESRKPINFIYNNAEWNKKSITYKVKVINNTKDILTKVSSKIYNFDDRYKYKSLTFYEDYNTSVIATLKTGETVELKGKQIILPDNVSLIEVKFNDALKAETDYKFEIESAPIKPIGDKDIELSVDSFGTSPYYMQYGSHNLKGGNKSVIAIFPFKSEAKPSINHYVVEDRKEVENPSYLVAGKAVKYKLGIEDLKVKNINIESLPNGQKPNDFGEEKRIDDLRNFKALLKLPRNFELRDIKVSDDFRMQEEATYNIIKKNGFTYILFKAKTFSKTISEIAEVNGLTTSKMVKNEVETPFYATWDYEHIDAVNKVTPEDDIKELIGDNPSLATSKYQLVIVKGVFYSLRLKDEDGEYRNNINTKKNILDYKAEVSNTNEVPVEGVVSIWQVICSQEPCDFSHGRFRSLFQPLITQFHSGRVRCLLQSVQCIQKMPLIHKEEQQMLQISF